jgi:rod shape determining protein RodA
MPIALVLKQPDLGTAALLGAVGLAVMFAGGVKAWKFAVAGAVGLAAMPIAWSVLHSYQRKRILSFLDPSSDPLGSGYHSTQSQIALGSGGIWGKGFLQGSQSHLSFIPESQTDFAFAVLAEEFGMMGALVVLTLFAAIIGYGIMISLRSRNQFGRLLALGLSVNFFLYVFINIAMVTGIFPVVGVPLPLISYGGTAMMTLMFGFGLVLSVYINRDARIGRFDDEI